MSDLGAVIWKETHELARLREIRTLGVILLLVLGVFLPFQRGETWLTGPTSAFLWLIVPVAVIISVVADSFAGEHERHTLEALLATRLSDDAILFGKLATVVAWSFGLVVALATLGFVAADIRVGALEFYRLDVLAAGLAAALLLAIAAASVGVLVSLRAATVRQAQQTLGIGLLVLGFGGSLAYAALPADWRASILRFLLTSSELEVALVVGIALVTLDAILLVACRARFRRARLVLD